MKFIRSIPLRGRCAICQCPCADPVVRLTVVLPYGFVEFDACPRCSSYSRVVIDYNEPQLLSEINDGAHAARLADQQQYRGALPSDPQLLAEAIRRLRDRTHLTPAEIACGLGLERSLVEEALRTL